jgi:hypothetical protein
LALAIPVYYLGDTPAGPRLYREFQSGRADDQVTEAARRAVAGKPRDPDYRTGWPRGSQVVSTDPWTDPTGQEVLFVDLRSDGTDLSVRPAGMSAEEAELAVQQVVYSVQGASGRRVPVQITLGGELAPTVLGVPMDQPVDRIPDRLALVNITAPEQGQSVQGTFKASGVANSFEANVPWELLDADGTSVLTGFATAEGMGDRLYPWTTTIDVSVLIPGAYTFVARTDDPSDGGVPGPTEDTKDFTIE